VGDAGITLVASGQERGPGGRTGGRDVEVLETQTLVVKQVDVGAGFLSAIDLDGSIADVVGHDHDDVGPQAFQ